MTTALSIPCKTFIFSPFSDATASPNNVVTKVESSTAITVQWDGPSHCEKVNGLIVKYNVQYRADFGGVLQSVLHPGEWNVMGAHVLLTELTPFTNYSIQVAAVNELGHVGLYSDPKIEQTQEDGEY